MAYTKNSGSIDLDAVQKELLRLETSKSDKLYVDGALKVIDTKVNFMERNLDGLDKQVGEVAKLGASAKQNATEATRKADQALSDSSSPHNCLHSNTLTNVKADLTRVTASVGAWDATVKRSTLKLLWAIIGLAVSLCGTAYGFGSWVGVTSNRMDVIEKSLIDTKRRSDTQEATLERIEAALAQPIDPTSFKTMIKEAYREVMGEDKPSRGNK